MSIYTRDRFCQVSLSPDFLCSQCHNILFNPVKCPQCRLVKCQDCVPEAPVCQHNFEKNDGLKKKIDDLLIRCRHYQHGCQKILKISQIGHHEADDCEYAKLKCDSKECESLSKGGEIKHTNVCGFYMINCELCHKEMRLKEKPKHNCIEWLNSVVDNLNFRNNVLSDEHENLLKENEDLNKSQENEKSQISKVIADLKTKNSQLNSEKEKLQRDLEFEVKTFDEQIYHRLKGFQSDSSSHLSDFHKKSQMDLEKHMSLVNDLMKNYLNNVTANLEGLNGNIDKENKVLEKVSKEEIQKMREKSPLRVFVNGTPKKNEGKGGKDNGSESRSGTKKGKK